MAHTITIGPDPETRAAMTAALIRGDVRRRQAEPLGAHVVYDPHFRPNEWPSPAEMNANGRATCNGIPRGEAPHMGASHVGVTADGEHAFLLKRGPDLRLDETGRSLDPIPAERIHDGSVARGANGGKPLPAEVYQGASFAKIWPKGSENLAHVYRPAPERAAEGKAFQGAPRSHTPTTDEGAQVAAAAHLAARAVPPPAGHVPARLEQLYPGHPVLHAIGETEDAIKAALGWHTTADVVGGWVHGLGEVIEGRVPGGRLPSDGQVHDEHKAGAQMLRDLLLLIRNASRGDANAVAQLEALGPTILELHPGTPDGDVARTVVAEVAAFAPGVVPRSLLEHVVRRKPEHVEDDDERRARRSRAACIDYDPALYLLSPADRDEGDLALDLALSDALGVFAVGCPGDGHSARRIMAEMRDPVLGRLEDIDGVPTDVETEVIDVYDEPAVERVEGVGGIDVEAFRRRHHRRHHPRPPVLLEEVAAPLRRRPRVAELEVPEVVRERRPEREVEEVRLPERRGWGRRSATDWRPWGVREYAGGYVPGHAAGRAFDPVRNVFRALEGRPSYERPVAPAAERVGAAVAGVARAPGITPAAAAAAERARFDRERAAMAARRAALLGPRRDRFMRGVPEGEAQTIANDVDRDAPDPILGRFGGGRWGGGRWGGGRWGWAPWRRDVDETFVTGAPFWEDEATEVIVDEEVAEKLKGFCPTGRCKFKG